MRHMFFDKGKTESCLVKAPAMHASESVLVVSELLCTGVQANTERDTRNETREMCSVGDTNKNSHWMRNDSRGLKSEFDRWNDGGAAANNFNRQRRDRSCKNSRESGHARKTVLADLSQKKKQSSDVDDEARHTKRICWVRAAHGRE